MKQLFRNPLLVGILATILSVLSFSLIYYLLIVPTDNDIKTQQGRIDANNDVGDAGHVKHSKDDLKKAQLQAKAKVAEWNAISARIMPAYNVSSRKVAWQQLANELSINLGPKIEGWLAHENTTANVTTNVAVSIQAPPPDPNLIDAKPLKVPIGGGTIQVVGPFKSILSHVVHWNNFDRLVMIDNLQLHGNSPFMTASYNADVYIFPQGAEHPGGLEAGVGGTGGGAGAAGGGGGGGGPASVPMGARGQSYYMNAKRAGGQ